MFSEIESFLFFYLKKRDKILINIQVLSQRVKLTENNSQTIREPERGLH